MILSSSVCSCSLLGAVASMNSRALGFAGLVYAVEHQRVQVGVQVGRAAKALDQGDGWRLPHATSRRARRT